MEVILIALPNKNCIKYIAYKCFGHEGNMVFKVFFHSLNNVYPKSKSVSCISDQHTMKSKCNISFLILWCFADICLL